jgi:hypothetical protein
MTQYRRFTQALHIRSRPCSANLAVAASQGKPVHLPHALCQSVFRRFRPALHPARAAKPPAGPDWVHEIKHDGYRLQVRRDGDAVRLFTRRGYDWSGRYRFVQPTSVASGWRHFWTFRPEIDPGLRRLELGKRKGKRVRKLPNLEVATETSAKPSGSSLGAAIRISGKNVQKSVRRLKERQLPSR